MILVYDQKMTILDPHILLMIFRVALHQDWSIYRMLICLSKLITNEIIKLGHPYPESLRFESRMIPFREDIPKNDQYEIPTKVETPLFDQTDFDLTRWSLFALPILNWTKMCQERFRFRDFYLLNGNGVPGGWKPNMLRVSISMDLGEEPRRLEEGRYGFLECIVFQSAPQPIILLSEYTSTIIHPVGNIVWMEFLPLGICHQDKFFLKTSTPAKVKTVFHIARVESNHIFLAAKKALSTGPWMLKLGNNQVFISKDCVYDDSEGTEGTEGARDQHVRLNGGPIINWSSVFRRVLPAFG